MHFGLGQILRLLKWVCQIISLKTRIVLKLFESDSLRSWKTREGHRKSRGKSWNLKSSKGYEPCRLDYQLWFGKWGPLSSPSSLLAVLLICSTFPFNRQRPGSITIQIIPSLTRNSMYSLRWACKRTNCQILCVVFDMLLKPVCDNSKGSCHFYSGTLWKARTE